MQKGRILKNEPPHTVKVEYYGGGITTFDLNPDGCGGTHLTSTDHGVPAEYRTEVIASWISVLMARKASVDFDVNLRNHNPKHTWEEEYLEN
jgi:hypothetical protein